jgi:hypothetical protein
MKILDIITESHNRCPHCGGPLVSESELMEKKDACYYKIKSSAKVWPSAYASGRLVQCRKKGAANYGNKSESVAEGVAETLPMSDAVELLRRYGADRFKTTSNELHFYKNDDPFSVDLIWNDDATRSVSLSSFNSATRGLKGQGVAEGENWSKHNNKRAGGMSDKSVKSYRRSHPGSKIQTAVTTKPSKLKKGSKAAKRRASFCARMRGMKKHRTGAKTANDPNSNINKSLRRWHCESIEELHELVMLAEQYIRNNKK